MSAAKSPCEEGLENVAAAHHEEDPTKLRRFMHPAHPGLLSASEALNYNNQMFLAQQNRQTHEMLEQVITQGYRKGRSASVSSVGASEASEEASEVSGITARFNAGTVLTANKDYWISQFTRWIEVKNKPVRKTRGRSGATETDATAFMGSHLDEEDEAKPAGVKEMLVDLLKDTRTGDRTALFLKISNAYAQENPDARGTKDIGGNRLAGRKSGSSTKGTSSGGKKPASPSIATTGARGKGKEKRVASTGVLQGPIKRRKVVGNGEEEGDEGEDTDELSDDEVLRRVGLNPDRDDDSDEELGEEVPNIRPGRADRRKSTVQIATDEGPRHTDSSFEPAR